MTTRLSKTSYSVIIPVKDEAESLEILTQELSQVLKKLHVVYEIIFIDDGSTDASYDKLLFLQKQYPHVTIIKFRANFGKSAALSKGFDVAQYDTIITLDADLQDDPNEIPRLLDKLRDGYDVVVGWRQKRHDSLYKRTSSLLFNMGTRFITGVQLHDFNSGLKVLKKYVAAELNLHGELHRFIPILATKRQFNVAEVTVHHRARLFGTSKYGLERSWRGIIDLLTTVFLTDYANKPAHFFGKIGFVFFTTGFILDAYVTYIRLSTGTTQHHIPLLLAGMLSIILGVQLLMTGLIAEMITYYHQKIEAMIHKTNV